MWKVLWKELLSVVSQPPSILNDSGQRVFYNQSAWRTGSLEIPRSSFTARYTISALLRQDTRLSLAFMRVNNWLCARSCCVTLQSGQCTRPCCFLPFVWICLNDRARGIVIVEATAERAKKNQRFFTPKKKRKKNCRLMHRSTAQSKRRNRGRGKGS